MPNIDDMSLTPLLLQSEPCGEVSSTAADEHNLTKLGLRVLGTRAVLACGQSGGWRTGVK